VLDEDSAVFEEGDIANGVYGCCSRTVFINKPPMIQKMKPIKGEQDEDIYSSITTDSIDNSIEFRDPRTNKIFLRTSIEKAT
jgi:hypothetical protein